MKKIIPLFLLLVPGVSAQAQRSQAKQAVEKSMEEKHGEPGLEKLDAWMNEQLLNVNVEPTYSFPVVVTMHMTSYRDGEKKSETDLRYYFNTPQSLFATDGSQSGKKKNEGKFMIYDHKANAMIMLNTTDKTGMAMNLNAFKSREQIEQKKSGDGAGSSNCSRTGKTQMIQGYKCEEYVCRDKEKNTRSEIWVTRDLKSGNMSGAKGLSPMWGSAQQAGGMLMAGKFYRNDQLESAMEVTELNTKADYNVNTKEYEFVKY